MTCKYVFILCPPYSGSTVLWQLLQTSPHVSALPTEGQYLQSAKHLMMADPQNPDSKLPWPTIKEEWSKFWDFGKPLLLEKSPQNLRHAKEIERVFSPCAFIVMMRDPYALCEGLARRRNRRNRLLQTFKQAPGQTKSVRTHAMEFAAIGWQRYADQQIQNLQQLERVTFLSYEELTQNAPNAVSKIVAFLPDLEHLDVTQKFRVHSVTGTDSRPLTNMNETKWQCLQTSDIQILNSVLLKRQDLLSYFGYNIRYPDRFHDLRATAVRSTSLILKLKNEARETISGRRNATTGRSRWHWLSRVTAGLPGKH